MINIGEKARGILCVCPGGMNVDLSAVVKLSFICFFSASYDVCDRCCFLLLLCYELHKNVFVS